MEYYSALKIKEIGSFEETWMDLKSVIQSKVSKSEREKQIYIIYMESEKIFSFYMFLFYCLFCFFFLLYRRVLG